MTILALPIKTDRLVLRAFSPNDLEAVMTYFTLPESRRYVDRGATDRAECARALDAMCQEVALNRPGETLSLAIERAEDQTLIGQVQLRWYDATAAQGELRFIIAPEYRGKGYATEAVSRVIDLAFGDLNIHRLFAKCDARNMRSAKLMQRIGMRLEAHYREHALFKGEWDEELHFALLDREWRRSSKVHELTHRVA